MVRNSTEDPDKGKRFAAVVAIIGALDIPFIHLSVVWFRSLHPEPVVAKPDGPTLPGDMLATLLFGVLVFSLLFFGLFLFRYAVEALRAEADLRSRSTACQQNDHEEHRTSLASAIARRTRRNIGCDFRSRGRWSAASSEPACRAEPSGLLARFCGLCSGNFDDRWMGYINRSAITSDRGPWGRIIRSVTGFLL